MSDTPALLAVSEEEKATVTTIADHLADATTSVMKAVAVAQLSGNHPLVTARLVEVGTHVAAASEASDIYLNLIGVEEDRSPQDARLSKEEGEAIVAAVAASRS